MIATDVRMLVDLARDKSSQGRSSLVTAIGDLMDDSGRILTLQEKALMNDILKKLIQDVARPIRKALAEKLSQSPNAPHEIVNMLGNDDFDIASPVLLKSDLLSDEDLVEIVRHRTLSHRLAIAMRRSVSTVVSDALVGTSSVDVIKALLENHGSQITDATMSSATAVSTRILGKKSTTYSAPRYISVWPFWRPKPLTSVTVKPVTPHSASASRTSSSLKGLMTAVIIFMAGLLEDVKKGADGIARIRHALNLLVIG